MSESILVNASSAASGSQAFYTHRADRVLVRCVPTGGGTPTVFIRGTVTSEEADVGSEIDGATSVPDTGFITAIADEPFYKVTVVWSDLWAGTLSVYTYVGGAS